MMASPNVMEFTTENWENEVVRTDKPVLVDFWAPWCGPCRALTPVVDRLADAFAGRAKVGKLNVDDHASIAVRYGVSSIPRIFIFQGTENPLKSYLGLTSEKELSQGLNELLQSPRGKKVG
jgi:thioredoxin 1